MSLQDAVGNYFGRFTVAYERAGPVMVISMAIGWLAYPVAVQTITHPADAIGFQAWMQGNPVPNFYTTQALFAGELTALVAFAALSLFQFMMTMFFYRRIGFALTMWPWAAVIVGLVANGAWWLWTGYFDAAGAMIGALPLVLTVASEAVCEKLGQDFVFGRDVRPQPAG